MLVLHDDAAREYAYGPAQGLPDTKVGAFTPALHDEAKKNGWSVSSYIFFFHSRTYDLQGDEAGLGQRGRQQEALTNKLIGGLALLVLVFGAGSSAHADGPWCAFYDASTYNCGFYSFEQCYETVRVAGASCRPNFFQNFGDGRQAGRRATTGRRN